MVAKHSQQLLQLIHGISTVLTQPPLGHIRESRLRHLLLQPLSL
jgi:hypothetical protein